jgi:hypothetical protein
MRSLDSTLKLYYSKKSEGQGFPKFRTSKDIEQSFVIRNQATSWTSSHLKIFKSPIRWDFHRPIPDNTKDCSISFDVLNLGNPCPSDFLL